MMQSYFPSSWSRLGLAALLTVGSLSVAHAQSLNYMAVGATNTAGTYTDLGTTGTVIATTSTDDANSAAQNIGFTFPYNGSTFTQFVFNTNGIIRLGSVAPSTAALYYDNNTSSTATDPLQSFSLQDINLIMPFNLDLVPGTGGVEYRVATTGTAGSRVCTIQWKNVADKAGAGSDAGVGAQYANFSFQLKLYEATAAIEFVYGPATASTNTAATRFPNIGLIGSDLDVTQVVLAVKGATAAWSAAAFQNYNYSQTVSYNIANVAPPDAGRTYHFNPAVACPATPALVSTFPYTQGFDGTDVATLPCGITVLDANNDDNSWVVLNSANGATVSTAPNAMAYIYSATNPGNDWFFTPPLALQAGMRYQLEFKYKAHNASYPEALEVKAGTTATPAGQTTTLFSNTNITNTTYATTTTNNVTAITPTANGTYYIGFHVISQANQDALFLDDLVVTASPVLATRGANNGVFNAEAAPVPFGNALTLTLNTQKAGPLALTMRDALGRVVRTTTAIAPAGTSAITVPETGSLSSGVYFLTVEQGGATQVLRVARQ
ncbi:MAG: T9SS type A sorting domain-containing protein [Janthinobacterium lividum]